MEKIKTLIIEEIAKLKQMVLETTQQIEIFHKEGDQDNVGISRQLQDQLEILQNKIENLQKNLAIYNQSKDCENICVGKSVSVSSGSVNKRFTIVLPENADPSENFISKESPLGYALMNKNAGDKVVFQTPNGSREFQIEAVE